MSDEDTPRVEEVTVNGIDWTAVDAGSLRAYLERKAEGYGVNYEAREAVESVLADLF